MQSPSLSNAIVKPPGPPFRDRKRQATFQSTPVCTESPIHATIPNIRIIFFVAHPPPPESLLERRQLCEV
ncbi:hypothetical protein BKA56DRAFT_106278 [Ilyonectria sp. MPI-CAGE-AT-0026]|nr:hypothetical protein BKA56DRAFT_106278 [Ilyonectria sp. MPI-CAGE-AT-0026]